MEDRLWTGPVTAPWSRLTLTRDGVKLPELEGGFAVRLASTNGVGRLQPGGAAVFPLLVYPRVPELLKDGVTTLTREPFDAPTGAYRRVAYHLTDQGVLSEFVPTSQAQPPPREASIVEVHRLQEAARRAGGAVVYATELPFAVPEVPPAPISNQVDVVSLFVVAAVGGFVGYRLSRGNW